MSPNQSILRKTSLILLKKKQIQLNYESPVIWWLAELIYFVGSILEKISHEYLKLSNRMTTNKLFWILAATH